MVKNVFFVFVFAILFMSCKLSDVKREIIDPEIFKNYKKGKISTLKELSPFLKAHMKNGNLYIFDLWDTQENGSIIVGKGAFFNSLRDTLGKDEYTIGLDSVALLETNVINNSGSGIALTLFTGVTTIVAALCFTNPKACFGSCPTYYVSDGNNLKLQAEGFSSSISPSLEATDVDALFHAKPSGRQLSVEMKNEALETHIVRNVNVLAVPKHESSRVFKDKDDIFWETTSQIQPIIAQGPEGDCLPALLKADGNERFSLSDETNLAKKEKIELQFNIHPGRTYGLIVGCRQSLLPTYLLYQTFAYMGNDVGLWLAEIERRNLRGQGSSIIDLIGGIDVEIQQQNGQWISKMTIDEHGPLAVDLHLIPLGEFYDSTLNIQLQMTKGTWRIDYVSLAEISQQLQPIRLHPNFIFKEGKEDAEALVKLLDSTKTLITLPGDCYTLKYTLPDDYKDYEFFLESRGYYLEWIRKEWIEEENPLLLAQLFIDPENALKRLAPEFKRAEPLMEDCFWRSRYAKP